MYELNLDSELVLLNNFLCWIHHRFLFYSLYIPHNYLKDEINPSFFSPHLLFPSTISFFLKICFPLLSSAFQRSTFLFLFFYCSGFLLSFLQPPHFWLYPFSSLFLPVSLLSQISRDQVSDGSRPPAEVGGIRHGPNPAPSLLPGP